MPKIKEIKKVEAKIKEIKVEKKETLEEEVEEGDLEDAADFIRIRRSNASSTLAQSESPQDVRTLQRVREKEDESEVNFRPSYTGAASPYASNTYTPVGSAESASNQNNRSQAESTLRQEDRFITKQEMQNQEQSRSASRPESGSERGYAGQSDQKEKDRRRQMM